VLLIGFVLTSGLAQVQANSSVIATIPIGIFPDGIVVSPDSSTVYVSDEFTNTVSVIDGVTNTLTATIPVGPAPGSLAITPDGLTLYVLLQGIDGVQVINTATKTAGTVFGAGSIATQLAVSPDGKYLYSMSESGIEIVRTKTNTFVEQIMTGSNPAYEIVFSPEGDYAYALCALNRGNGAADGILQINTATLQQEQLLWGKLNNANNITITPDGKRLYNGTSQKTRSCDRSQYHSSAVFRRRLFLTGNICITQTEGMYTSLKLPAIKSSTLPFRSGGMCLKWRSGPTVSTRTLPVSGTAVVLCQSSISKRTVRIE